MKIFKHFFILVVTCILITNVASAQHWDTNGNFTGLNDFLGTTNSQVLNFKTNNAFRMRLMNNTGYLGLGAQTFTPSALLHVNMLSYSANFGKLFRTDGRSNLDLSWSMYSGNTVGSSIQRARFWLSPSTETQQDNWHTDMFNDSENHLQIESTLGDIVLEAKGSDGIDASGELAERMRITSMLFRDAHWGSTPVFNYTCFYLCQTQTSSS